MSDKGPFYDAAVADGRFQLEVLAIRWALTGLYGVFVAAGLIAVDMPWYIASQAFLVVFHIYYTWYVWREMGENPLPEQTAYATPFLDTAAVTMALIAVGNPLHPIWGVYFIIIAGVAFFYYPVMRAYTLWLLACYALLGLAVHWRGGDPPVPHMIAAATVLFAALLNIGAYTGGERRLRGRITEVTLTDPLTGLLNRRGLEKIMNPAAGEDDRLKNAFAVFMLDIDRFKRYNDQYGHITADKVLEHLANILREAVREPDLVARYGGDEFVVIVPDVTGEEAMVLAERLRGQVERLGLCTVSIGVTFAEGRDVSASNILDLADAALLIAKGSGRNCVRGPDLEQAAA